MESSTLLLAHRTIAVTRAVEQAGPLVEQLRNLGAEIVEIAAIETIDPEDGGVELRGAARAYASYDWVVFTSPNAAARYLAEVLKGSTGTVSQVAADFPKIAVVGPGTAEVVSALGFSVSLVPEESIGDGLARMFPRGPGSVLLPRAETIRRIVPDALLAKRWDVDEVVAYRTIAKVPSKALLDAAFSADAIVFTSSSTVTSLLAAAPERTDWPSAISIGPETTATLRANNLPVLATASPHTIPGLVNTIVRALGPRATAL
jgi:uroporphyrinogen-III synthase